jgi:Txe/YoeB family toxin of Txe-Axe toxin-antitoxin module
MEGTDGTQSAEISSMAVWLPPFWAEWRAMWFAQVEAQFSLAGISSERTTFHYVISQLDQRYAAEVEDIITSPQQDPYSKLRTELLKHLFLSMEQRVHRILTLEEMGDRKPLQLLRHPRSLVPDLPDYFLRKIWTSRLPAKVQATLACHP